MSEHETMGTDWSEIRARLLEEGRREGIREGEDWRQICMMLLLQFAGPGVAVRLSAADMQRRIADLGAAPVLLIDEGPDTLGLCVMSQAAADAMQAADVEPQEPSRIVLP